MALGGLEKDALLLGEAMADAAVADFSAGGFASAESLHIVFMRSGHESYGESRAMFQAEFCNW